MPAGDAERAGVPPARPRAAARERERHGRPARARAALDARRADRGGASSSSSGSPRSSAACRPTSRQGLLGEDEGSAGRVSWLCQSRRARPRRRRARARRSAALFAAGSQGVQEAGAELRHALSRRRRRRRASSRAVLAADPRRATSTTDARRRTSTGRRSGSEGVGAHELGRADDRAAVARRRPRSGAHDRHRARRWRSAPASTRRRAASCGCCRT